MSKPKLLDQVRDAIRVKHYSVRTEEAYVHWIKRFILFHEKRHPLHIREPEVSKFISHLAVEGKVSASTQNQALSAILFLYQEVLKQELGWINNVKRAKKPSHLPVVFTKEEAKADFSYNQIKKATRRFYSLSSLSVTFFLKSL